MRRLAWIALAAVWLACSRADAPPADATVSTAGSGGGGSGGGGAGGTPDPGPNELPCDVREALEARCTACHSSPPCAHALLPLVSRYDFLATPGDTGQTVGERSVVRMHDAAMPMPPASEPPAAPSQLAAIETWVDAGMPPGACGAIPGKPAATTCTSNDHWIDTEPPSALMAPGLACGACHETDAPAFDWFFMGTVYPSFHEEDGCKSPPPADARIEILDPGNQVTLTLLPNEVGNFMSQSVAPGVAIPFRARLVANGLARSMNTFQIDGDCNRCHTEQGDHDAPGRLVWPSP